MGVASRHAARVVGVGAEVVQAPAPASAMLPQCVGMVGQALDSLLPYDVTPTRIVSAAQAAELYGLGSPLHRMAQIALPASGGGLGGLPLTAYPILTDGASVAAVGRINVSGATLREAIEVEVILGGISSGRYVAPAGTSRILVVIVLAIVLAGIEELPMLAAFDAGGVGLTSKTAGAVGNSMPIELVFHLGSADGSGLVFTVVPPTGGSGAQDVTPALTGIGARWETILINGLNPEDDTALQAYRAWGDERWGAVEARPAVVVTGSRDPDIAAAVDVTLTHVDDRVNALVVLPGAGESPWAIAAAAAIEVASIANENAPQDYSRAPLVGLRVGAANAFFDYTARDASVRLGISTTELAEGVGVLSDMVTMYHVDEARVLSFFMACGEPLALCGEALGGSVTLSSVFGEPIPSFRSVVDIMKLMNVIHRIRTVFESQGWRSAPLLPGAQLATNPAARKPRDAAADLASIVDGLAREAFIADPVAAKRSIAAAVDSGDPKRLNVGLAVSLAGNANIRSVDLDFGFFN